MGERTDTRRRAARCAETIRVCDHLSYRSFLQAVYEAAKEQGAYSYERFAEELGFSRSNVLWLVVSGRRKLTRSAAERVAKSLGLAASDKRYLVHLCEYNNARNPEQREAVFQKLLAIRERAARSDDERKGLEYFGEWYHPVIREMAALPDFRSDPEWIAARMSVKVWPKHVREALSRLVALGVLRWDEAAGRHVQAGGQIPADRNAGSHAVIRYHQKVCELAKEAVTRVPARERELNALTVTVDRATAMRIAELLYETCEKIMQLEAACAAPPEDVYQVNLQLFPLTAKNHV